MELQKALSIFILGTGLALASPAGAAVNEACPGMPFFSAALSPTCWANSSVYLGNGASFATCGSNSIPVNLSELGGSLDLATTLPTGAYWNCIINIGGGKEVDVPALSAAPVLHLKLRWSRIAGGEDLRIQLQDNNSVQGGAQQSASVILSNYALPSAAWQDVYIPLADFTADNPLLNTTRILQIYFFGLNNYNATSELLVNALEFLPSANCAYNESVKANQVGYTPQAQKIGLVSFLSGAAPAPTVFQVLQQPGGSVSYSGSLALRVPSSSGWDQSGDVVYQADFSALQTPGTYVLYAPELGQQSYPFSITCTAMNTAFRDALRFFYYARSGPAIVAPQAEGYPRQAYFAADSAAPYDYNTSLTRDVAGGWFDAGDPHKDVHNQRHTMFFLLEALKDFRTEIGPGGLDLPESDGSHSDLFYLVKWELDWMTKMWNPDGSVQFWVGYGAPAFHAANGEVSGISSGSAAVLAAVFAKAYPLFKAEPGFSSYADGLLSMAKTSWAWLQANPSLLNPTNPAGGVYGYEFTASQDAMARDWAAVELYDATGDTTCHAYFTGSFSNPLTDFGGNQSWGGVIDIMGSSISDLAYMDYINSPQPTASASIQATLKNAFENQCNFILGNMAGIPYRIPMVANNDLYWGSSAELMGNLYTFAQAWQWTGNSAYLGAAYDAGDWVLGRNPVSRCFLSGLGTRSTDIYSFYWLQLGQQPPGYLSGNVDAYSSLQNVETWPWKCWTNIQDASVLEPCINYNAQAAWGMGWLSSACGLPTPSPVPTGTPSVTATSSASPSATPSDSPSATPSASQSATPTASSSATPSASLSAMPSASTSATPSASPSATPTAGPSASLTPSSTLAPTASESPALTATPTPSLPPPLSPTATLTLSAQESLSASPSASAQPSASVTPSPGASALPSASITPSDTPSPGPTPPSTASPATGPTTAPSPLPSATPSATPAVTADEGPLLIAQAGISPLPAVGGALSVYFELQGPADAVTGTLYTQALVRVVEGELATTATAGWSHGRLLLPEGTASGVYFVRIQAQRGQQRSKAIVLKAYYLNRN